MQQVGHLSDLHSKYFDKGLRVIAISAEPAGTIKSKLLEDKQPSYWVASDPGRTTMGRFTQPGRLGIPHAYLVDATGTVISEGVPSEGTIEKLLEGAFIAKLDRELHKSLASAVKSFEKGDYGKAWAAAARYLENEDRQIVADAQYLRDKVEAAAAFQKKLVEGGIKAKDYATVYDDLKFITKAFAGMEIVGWAAETKKKLDADADVKTEMKAWKAWEKAQAKEQKAGGKEKKLAAAKTAYGRIVKKYPGTRAAELAGKALKRLGG